MATVLGTVRRVRIGKRLLIAFGLIVALIIVIAVIGVTGGNSQSSASTELSQSVRSTREAMQVKFRAADFNGWQTAYAFDVVRGLNNATSDSSPSRKAFLASAAAFRRELAALSGEQLTAAERRNANGAKNAFDQFMATDNQVISLYRQGTPEAIKAANALVLGREITLFNDISAHTSALDASSGSRRQRRPARAADAASSARPDMIIVGLLAALVAVGLALVIARSIAVRCQSSSESASGSPKVTWNRPSRRRGMTR